MKTKFAIQIKTMDLYRFLMYHSYRGFSGIFSIIAGLGLIGFYAVRHSDINNSWLYLAFGLLFLVYMPWTLFNRAAQQVKLGATFKKPIQYSLSKEGIEVKQGDASAQVKWENVLKVKETSSNILVYTGAKNAFVWPKKQLGNAQKSVIQSLKQNVSANKLSLR